MLEIVLANELLRVAVLRPDALSKELSGAISAVARRLSKVFRVNALIRCGCRAQAMIAAAASAVGGTAAEDAMPSLECLLTC